MVKILVGLVLVLFLVIAVSALRFAWRGSRVLSRVRQSRPKKILEVDADGPAEIEGTIHAVGEPIRAPSGRRCVAVVVDISSRGKDHSKSPELARREMRRSTKSVVRDATGEMVVDLTHVAVSAPVYTAVGERKEYDAGWTDGMPGAWFFADEACIEDGAQVVVSGRARTIRSEASTSADGGYRGAAPEIVAIRRIEGTEDDRIVVSDGSRSTLMRRAAFPVVLLVATALASLGYGAAAAFILSI